MADNPNLHGVMLYLMATTDTIVMGYAGYIVFRALYQMIITVASFLALGFQTIMTTVVAPGAAS